MINAVLVGGVTSVVDVAVAVGVAGEALMIDSDIR